MDAEEPEESAGCAGAVLVTVLALGGAWAAHKVFPNGSILLLWIVGWGAVIWATGYRRHTPNPAPPPLPERGAEQNPQVTVMRDTSHRNRWIVTRPSPWLTYDPAAEADNETGTEQ